MQRSLVAVLAAFSLLGSFVVPALAQTSTPETTSRQKMTDKTETKTTTKEKDNTLSEMRERQVKSDRRAKAQRAEMTKDVKNKTSDVKKKAS
ncbi:hypothetical protein [Gloeobacter kilaueensis]|uniref:Uncharacterized protein n=1 Tax=Gloeobacter kilaueensis (strain ATCC BAA-2537 / CCAP 1431/1 / ULC 316 / JS1) TaxID=1183438 RepID=U5QEI4_GLOK1|nr:hypothetical protein [Gloeobacter kilaueensis]AGY57301.1 hypothetical protein GKIL_1055 [Gloeobacter kilaueensis JS1]